VEHDPVEIWSNTQHVIRTALARAGIQGSELAAIGVTNQRETTVVWDKNTGQPYFNAIVWQCTRTDEICRDLVAHYGQEAFESKTGLPWLRIFQDPSSDGFWTTFLKPSAPRRKATRFWNGGQLARLVAHRRPQGGVHVTDVTNASRTMLMDLDALEWEESILRVLNIPRPMLPKIVPSSDRRVWGYTSKDGPLNTLCLSVLLLGISRRPWWGKRALRRERPRTPMGQGVFSS